MKIIHKQLSLEENGKLLYKENLIKKNAIREGEVRVKPINVGLCSSDIPRCFDGKSYFYPLVIGHEFLVSILEDPSGEFIEGERCAVFPLRPCFKCKGCESKEFNKCSSYSYYGSRTSGGMQSWLDINKWNLFKLPSPIDDISGGLIEPLAVCIHASKFIEKNKSILLYGGGFLSQILSQILRNKGCEITCIDRNEYKKVFFDNDVNFSIDTTNLDDSLFDYSLECCGANNIFEECIRLTKPSGKIIQLANPNVDLKITSNVLSKLMRKELLLVGSWNSLYRPDKPELCEWNLGINMLLNNQISINKLISHKAKIENSADLINKVYGRRNDKNLLPNFNKALIQIT